MPDSRRDFVAGDDLHDSPGRRGLNQDAMISASGGSGIPIHGAMGGQSQPHSSQDLMALTGKISTVALDRASRTMAWREAMSGAFADLE